MQKLIDLFTLPVVGFLLKLFAGIAAAVFGIIGLGRDARDKASGELTPKGRIARIGIIAAGALTVGSVTYDYVFAQKAAADDKRKSEHLLLTVQRGVYPLRSITGELKLSLSGDIAGLKQYMKTLDLPIQTNDASCPTTEELECISKDDDDGAPIYLVPQISKLFPRPGSQFGEVLRGLGITVTFIARRAGDVSKEYSLAGSFHFFVDEVKPQDVSLLYLTKSHRMILWLKDFEVPDEAVVRSGLYSLVEFFPGFVAVDAGTRDFPLCFGLDLSKTPNCKHFAIQVPNPGLGVEELWMKFKYPRTIRVDEGGDFQCRSADAGLMTVVVMPPDVDDLDELGNRLVRIDSKPYQQSLCAAFDNPGF
jgi:hypothetical protein